MTGQDVVNSSDMSGKLHTLSADVKELQPSLQVGLRKRSFRVTSIDVKVPLRNLFPGFIVEFKTHSKNKKSRQDGVYCRRFIDDQNIVHC